MKFQFSFFVLVMLAFSSSYSWAENNLHIYAHAHNDYEHDRPLLDALRNHFYSVEIDIWIKESEIVVAHDWGDFKGTFKELYLEPLQSRVDEKGSVYGDNSEFFLWVDIKDSKPELLNALHNLLKGYSMLTHYENDQPSRKPVTVILTGSKKQKTKYVDEFDPRYACRDSNSFDETSPQATTKWPWYALNWGNHFDWRSRNPMPGETFEKLNRLVEAIHSKGRRVRFYATPDHKYYWQAALKVGVDFINTDRLQALHEFLQEREQSSTSVK